MMGERGACVPDERTKTDKIRDGFATLDIVPPVPPRERKEDNADTNRD